MKSNNLRLLFSYAYLKPGSAFSELALSLHSNIKLLIDSGAFTAFHCGREIKVEQYTADCLKHYHNKVWQYIQLDKIKNPQASRDNLQYMLDKGTVPMPVQVVGEDMSRMEYLVSVNPYICVAGGADGNDKYAIQRYQQAFKASKGKAKIHGLGFLRFPEIYQVPLYSGDSSTYANGSKFGIMYGYSKRKGPTILRQGCGEAVRNPIEFYKQLPDEAKTFMNGCGVVYKDLIERKLFINTTSSFVSFSAVNAYLNFSYDAGNYYDREIFLAIGSTSWFFISLAVHAHKTGSTFDYEKALKEYHYINTLFKNKEFDKCHERAELLSRPR